MMRYRRSNKSGFTLIEVILAISILSTLSVLVATSTSRALKARRKIQAEVSDVSALRDTMKTMKADIYQAYNHFDFEKEIMDELAKPTTPKPGATSPPPPTTAPITVQRQNKRQSPRTSFVGTESELHFVTMNNGRMTANDLQADFIEVGYFLKDCRNLSKPELSSRCLFRRTEKVVDNDVTKGGTETVILENISEMTLRYLVEGKEDWVKEWKMTPPEEEQIPGNINANQNQQKPVVKSIFPDAIEITIAIEREFDKKTKKYSLQYVVPLHFPNNK